MSLQTMLDNEGLSLLPKTHEAIKNAPQQEASQMTSLALQVINQASSSLADMSTDELSTFDRDMIDRFVFNQWLEPDDNLKADIDSRYHP